MAAPGDGGGHQLRMESVCLLRACKGARRWLRAPCAVFRLGLTRPCLFQTQAEFKLPALYLLDSIAKNLRAQYANVLEQHVAELYTVVWEALPTQRRSLERLRATWRTVFPSVRVMPLVSGGRECQCAAQHLATMRSSWLREKRQPHHHRPAVGCVGSVRSPPLSLVSPRLDARPAECGCVFGRMRPLFACTHLRDRSPIVRVRVIAQAFVALEQHFAAAAAAPAPQAMGGWMPGASGPWQQGAAPGTWAPQQQAPQMMATSWYPEQAAVAPMVMPPSMVYGQHVVPPLVHNASSLAQHHHHMYGQPATQLHGDHLVPPMQVGHADGGWGSAATAPGQQMNAFMPPSLASLLADLAQSVAAPGAPQSSLGDARAASAPATPEARLDFDANAVRGAANQKAIGTMYGDQKLQCPTTGRRFRDAAMYASHLEVQALQQRKEGQQLSRRWFVPFDTWASGAAAVGADPHAAGAFFDEQEAAAVAKAAEIAKAASLSLPVDEAQPRCALTGETFETFWHAELEEWHYRGAVRLDKATGGVPAGRLVLAKAIPKLDNDAAKALLDSRAVALDLAAAAAAMGTEAPLPPPYTADAAAVALATDAPPAAQDEPAGVDDGDGDAAADAEDEEHAAKRQKTNA